MNNKSVRTVRRNFDNIEKQQYDYVDQLNLLNEANQRNRCVMEKVIYE